MSFVDEYLASVPTAEKAQLERIREIVHEIIPDVEEVKTYGMPGFKYKGKYIASFAAFKDHLSFFPGAIPEDILPKLKGFIVSKGTIQFTLDKPIPKEVIRELLERRVSVIAS